MMFQEFPFSWTRRPEQNHFLPQSRLCTALCGIKVEVFQSWQGGLRCGVDVAAGCRSCSTSWHGTFAAAAMHVPCVDRGTAPGTAVGEQSPNSAGQGAMPNLSSSTLIREDLGRRPSHELKACAEQHLLKGGLSYRRYGANVRQYQVKGRASAM